MLLELIFSLCVFFIIFLIQFFIWPFLKNTSNKSITYLFLAMRSSISSSLEPGLERGVPWGRDLYTFVTSAAGHMMRTLQKPRKNRPSKRQVNHRRFLHNMIQRCVTSMSFAAAFIQFFMHLFFLQKNVLK